MVLTPIRAALAVCLIAGPALAEDEALRGARLFADHCAMCHGGSARGDGPMTAVLTVRPADLTRLSAENGGVFPLARVIARIDGRQEVLAHGGPMPVFGLALQGPEVEILAPDGSDIAASAPIADIVAWLRAVQRGG